jgi:hypothetical protein
LKLLDRREPQLAARHCHAHAHARTHAHAHWTSPAGSGVCVCVAINVPRQPGPCSSSSPAHSRVVLQEEPSRGMSDNRCGGACSAVEGNGWQHHCDHSRERERERERERGRERGREWPSPHQYDHTRCSTEQQNIIEAMSPLHTPPIPTGHRAAQMHHCTLPRRQRRHSHSLASHTHTLSLHVDPHSTHSLSLSHVSTTPIPHCNNWGATMQCNHGTCRHLLPHRCGCCRIHCSLQ